MNGPFKTQPTATMGIPLVFVGVAAVLLILSQTTHPNEMTMNALILFTFLIGAVGLVWTILTVIYLAFRLVSVSIDEELVVKQRMFVKATQSWTDLVRINVDSKVVHMRGLSRELMQINLDHFDAATANNLVHRLHKMAVLNGVGFYFE